MFLDVLVEEIFIWVLIIFFNFPPRVSLSPPEGSKGFLYIQPITSVSPPVEAAKQTYICAIFLPHIFWVCVHTELHAAASLAPGPSSCCRAACWGAHSGTLRCGGAGKSCFHVPILGELPCRCDVAGKLRAYDLGLFLSRVRLLFSDK